MSFRIGLLLITGLIWGCTEVKKAEKYTPPKTSNQTGEQLANTYCGSCHQVPAPELLDKMTWQEGVLPKMAYRLGLEPDMFKVYGQLDVQELELLSTSGVYPAKPVITQEDWLKIVDYYVGKAPQKPLPQPKKEAVTMGLPNFKVKSINGISTKIPFVTFVKFNPAQKSIYLGFRGQESFLKQYNLNLIQQDSIPVPSPVSDIDFSKPYPRILTMGLMDPNDQRKGTLIEMTSKNQSKVMMQYLQRPVQVTFGDLTQDGTEDFVLCSFGNELGKLAWYEGEARQEHLLKLLPGARNAIIKDMNGDKLPDIVVLMTQAREGIFIYYSQGKGRFTEKQVLEFPSVYGSSYVDVADFNNDGLMDIVYTNGDNADLSISLKSYHGVRVFLNDKKGNFKQSYFYPMFGASKAMAADFDLDGDMDIAAISFFTNPLQSPHEGFLLLDNQGENRFNVATFPEAVQGKWMVMDVADMDKDGDSDIILGSFLRRGMKDVEDLKMGRKLPPSAIILENKKRVAKTTL
jgi:hypothetical protein